MPQTVSSDGIDLYYDVHGAGETDLILLHGMGAARATWKPMVDHLDLRVVRAIIPDLRGHDRSGGSGEGFTYPQLHSDLLAVATHAGVREGVIVAFSGSCKNAAWFAAESPERVRGLVFIGPPGMDIVPIPRAALALAFDMLELTGHAPREFDAWFTEKTGANRASVMRSLAQTRRSVLDASAELWVHTSVVAQAARVIQPVLVVAGVRDAFYPPEFQRQTTLVQIPHASMEVLDCAHFIPCEEPESVVQLLGKFMNALSRVIATPAQPGPAENRCG